MSSIPVEDVSPISSTYSMVAYVCGAIGTFGAVAVILSYFLVRDMRTTSRTLVFFLALCDLGQGLRFVTIDLDTYSRQWCVIQAVWGVWISTASFLWTASIAAYVYSVLRAPHFLFPRWGLWAFHIISWGYPSIFAAINLLESDVSVASPADEPHLLPYCYMSQKWRPGWRALGFAVPLLLSWTVTAIMYYRSKRLIQNFQLIPLSNEGMYKDGQTELREMHNKFVCIPIAFFLLRVWDAIQNIHLLMFGMDAVAFPQWFLILQIAGDSLQGFVNFIVFVVMTANIRTRFWKPAGDAQECSPISTGIPVYNYS